MLPNFIYKSLPYLYIVAGLLCWVAIESILALIPAVLLVLTGLLVIWMRRRAKKGVTYTSPDTSSDAGDMSLSKKGSEQKIRFGERRFPAEDQDFPITDSSENMIAFNRRTGKRRKDEDE